MILNFDDYMIGKTKFVRMTRDLSNWVKTSDLIYDTQDPKIIKEILYVECKTKKREFNIQRIYTRFKKLRKKQELDNLSTFLKDVKPVEDWENIRLTDLPDFSAALLKRVLKAEFVSANRLTVKKVIYNALEKAREEVEWENLRKLQNDT